MLFVNNDEAPDGTVRLGVCRDAWSARAERASPLTRFQMGLRRAVSKAQRPILCPDMA